MRVHFIAIGGAAMHNLALALHAMGYNISGSDDEIYNPSRARLEAAGLLPNVMGWFPERITHDLDVVILGMHAKPDNPELQRAQQLGIKVYSYPEFVYDQSMDKKRVVIAGSHGKTTTTAMLLHVLKKKKIDFDYLVGAQLRGFDRMVRLSDAPIIVIEGDEYLSSPIDNRPKMLHYKPHLAVITGVAWDHINVFKTFEDYQSQFVKLVELMENDGVIICFDDQEVTKVLEKARTSAAVIRYKALAYSNGKVTHENKAYPMSVFGDHNLANMNAAMLISKELGISANDFLREMSDFTGAAKRLELIKESDKSSVFLDFAHAPSKAQATVNAVKSRNRDRTLVAVFELHTFSSLSREFLKEYRATLNQADQVMIYLDAHTLKMKGKPVLDSSVIIESFDHKALKVSNTVLELESSLSKFENSDNHNFLFMSSGHFGHLDIKKWADRLIPQSNF